LSRILRHESLNASLLYTALGALVPVALVVGRVWTPLSVADVIPAFLTGLLSIAILGCFDVALEDGPVWMVAPLVPLVLIWETALWAIVRGATVHGLDALGIVLAVLASGLVLSVLYFNRTH